MSSDHFYRSACFDSPIYANDVVIAHHLEVSLTMPAVDVLHDEVLAFDCGRAVDDDLGYRSHGLLNCKPPVNHVIEP